jgi:hypothetical protein
MDLYPLGKGWAVVYIDFADPALGALVASHVALESLYGQRAADIILCVTLLLQVHHLADLRRFRVLALAATRNSEGVWNIDVTANGTGLRAVPTDADGRRLAPMASLEESSVEGLAVTALIGIAVPAGIGSR